MAPAVFLKAYVKSTTEEFRQSEDAPKLDAKNPAGWLPSLKLIMLRCQHPLKNTVLKYNILSRNN